jgi:hypothetical protein
VGGRPLDLENANRKEALVIVELRQYHLRPGQRDNWVKCMEEEIIPFQVIRRHSQRRVM